MKCYMCKTTQVKTKRIVSKRTGKIENICLKCYALHTKNILHKMFVKP